MPSISLFRPLILVTSLLLAGSFATACSDDTDTSDTSSASANVTVTRVSPSPTYTGVMVSVNAQITPESGTSSDALSWEIDWGDGQEPARGEDIAAVNATHAWELSGEFTIEVKALSGSTTIASTQETITILAPTDLAISEVGLQPANVESNDQLSITAVLENLRPDDVPGPLTIFSYLATTPGTPQSTADLIPLGSTTLESFNSSDPSVLDAGQSKEITITQSVPPSVESGEYTVVVEVDSMMQIADDDRSNNIAAAATKLRVTSISQIEPDLALENILVSPDRAFPELNSFTRQVDLQNRGQLDAFGAILETYLSIGDNVLDDNDTLVDVSEPIDTVAARMSADLLPANITLGQPITPPAGEELQVWVIVRVKTGENTQAETNLTNNVVVSDQPIIVTDEPVNGPDIAVKSFEMAPDQTFLGGTLDATLELANEGTDDVSSFLCRIYLSEFPNINTVRDRAVESINISGLKSGETTTFERNILISALFDPGTFYFYVVCDPSDALGEPFRSNNQALYNKPVVVTDESDIDMFGDSITLPEQANEGDEITITAKVCAKGSNATGVTQAGLYRSPGFAVDYINSEPIATAEVPSMQPGECEELTFTYTTSCEQFEERYAFGIRADIENSVVETNESNNTRSGDNLLTLSGKFCACNEDSFEPNNLSNEAKPIAAGLMQPLALCAKNTCDFFRTPTLQPGESLVIRNRFESARGPLRTRLFDSTGAQTQDSDARDLDTQEVATFLSPGTDYILEVCGKGPFVQNLYELDVEVIPQAATFDLLVRSIELPPKAQFSLGATLEVDFKVYNLGLQATPAGFDAEIRISSDSTIDTNDTLLATVPLDALDAAKETLQQATVQLPAMLSEGTYYIGITLDPSGLLAGETNTTNNVALSAPIEVTAKCYDPLEPNDSFDEVYAINSSSMFNNIIACADTKDFYELCLPGDKKFTFSIDFNNANGDLDLFLFDSQRKKIASSATFQNQESISVPYVNGAQCYFVSVELISPGVAETNYNISFDLQDVDPSLRCNSLGEPNDDFITASSLTSATSIQSIDRCPKADADYYFFDVAAANTLVTIKATKTPALQPGNLQIQLYNPNQIAGTNAATAPDKPEAEIKFFAASAGRHWVKITADGNARNFTYSLTYEGSPPGVDITPVNLQIGPGVYQSLDNVRLGFDLSNLGDLDVMGLVQYEISLGLSSTPDPANDVPLVTNTAPGVVAKMTASAFEQFQLPNISSAGTAYIHIKTIAMGDVNPANDTASLPIQVTP